MKGDIFNNSTGQTFKNCCLATGDMFSSMYNANGDILSSCTLHGPTSDELTMLRNENARTKTNLAIAESTLADLKHRADACLKAKGFRCKKKYGGTKNQLLDQRNAAAVERDAAKQAYETAASLLAEAEKDAEMAKADYKDCQKAEQEKALQDAELKKQADLIAVEESKVGVQKMEAGKDYFKYGMAGIGILLLGIIGYKMITR
jgi:hypothetical protein